METTKVVQITCIVYQPITNKALGAMEALGVEEYDLQPCRAVMLRRKDGFMGIGEGIGLEEELSDRITFYVSTDAAEIALQALVDACNLTVPGRGSAVCEEIDIVKGSAWNGRPLTPVPGTDDIATQNNLASITCTKLAFGRGNSIANSVLDLGVPMPLVAAGTGTGLRDKLGVVRVALPAEKEMVNAFVTAHETHEVLGSLFDSARLDRFGAGFIYGTPLVRGVINHMVVRGQRHAASMEQLIAAVDDIKGSPEWRKRSLGDEEAEANRRYDFAYDLVNLTLICNESKISQLTQAILAAGVSGSVIVRLSHARFDGAESTVFPSREMTELIIGKDEVEEIAGVILDAGLFDKNLGGVLAIKPVSVACNTRRTA